MFWIIGGEQLIHALAETTKWPAFIFLSSQMHHTAWNGVSFYDMIFPLFLFIAGVALPLSLRKQLVSMGVEHPCELPMSERASILKTMFRRALTLVLLGMIVNGALKFNGYENIRFASVLGRIGLAWLGAGLIYLNFKIRGQLIWFFLLLIFYWLAMRFVPVPGFGPGNLTPQGSLQAYLDGLILPGRLHSIYYDPEGIFSTTPAVATGLLGLFTGIFLSDTKQRPVQKVVWMIVAALVLFGAGMVWDISFPINKRLWTSSFVLVAGGYSLALLAIFYLIVDVLGYVRWAFPFILIGTNSIAIYVAFEGLIDFQHTADYVFGGIIGQFTGPENLLLKSLALIVTELAFLLFLYKNKIFVKV